MYSTDAVENDILNQFPSASGVAMKDYLRNLNVYYNNIDCPVGSGGHIVEQYPEWLEDNTLWKVRMMNKSFLIMKPTPVYYELAKASYLELTLQETLPEWTHHQIKCFNQSLMYFNKKRLTKLIEEERQIQQELLEQDEFVQVDDYSDLEEEEEEEEEEDNNDVVPVDYVDLYNWLAPYFTKGYFSV
jgi:hypothetical protein